MKTIAITGGIGSGKSELTGYLTELGYTVIDADKMSREITGPGGKAMPYILEMFGPQFIEADGSLNRMAMRELVFRNPGAMKLLEAGTTAVVIEDIAQIRRKKEQEGCSCLFFDIPLLYEKHQEDNYDEVWVVSADYEIRRQRVMRRDKISADIIDLIMDTQQDENDKAARADVVIHNNGSIDEMRKQVDEILEKITPPRI